MLMDKAEVGLAQDGLAQKWGWVVARGVIAVLFGLIAFSRPGPMAFGMVLLFGCYAFAAGIATVIAAARSGRAGSSWGALLMEGLLGIAIGVLAVLWPASTALSFVWLIGAWAVLTGVLEIASAVRLRKVIETRMGARHRRGAVDRVRAADVLPAARGRRRRRVVAGRVRVDLGRDDDRARVPPAQLRARAPRRASRGGAAPAGRDPERPTAAIRSWSRRRRTTRTTGNGSRRPTTG